MGTPAQGACKAVIGLALKSFQDNSVPGSRDMSFGFNCEDGTFLQPGGAAATPIGKPVKKGDIIGCGWDVDRNELWFTVRSCSPSRIGHRNCDTRSKMA